MSNRGDHEAECICLNIQVKTVVVVNIIIVISIIILTIAHIICLTIVHFINRHREKTHDHRNERGIHTWRKTNPKCKQSELKHT